MKRKLTYVTLILVLANGCAAPPAGDVADAVYTNGRIYTVDESQPWVEAVGIKDGKFIWVRLFWNGGFGMSHSGKGSSHLTRLRWRPLTGTTLPSA